jgi:pyrroline-5-carboxylate reductase
MNVAANKTFAMGAGRLGESMLRGFPSSAWRESGEIVVKIRRAERRDSLVSQPAKAI